MKLFEGSTHGPLRHLTLGLPMSLLFRGVIRVDACHVSAVAFVRLLAAAGLAAIGLPRTRVIRACIARAAIMVTERVERLIVHKTSGNREETTMNRRDGSI
jgi:hypothetical protein